MDSFQEKYNALVIKYNALLAENEELEVNTFTAWYSVFLHQTC
ncbi:hypothetical protein NXX77_09135 [Phocaeicola dorei]|nr:hypothetical protein [Phocaeicola dorei]MCS3153505.1 hypothetical protein [Phocaeicola dorei]